MGCVGSIDKKEVNLSDDLWNILAHPQFHINMKDNKGHTPLILCVQHNMAMIPKLMVYKDLDINMEDHTGRTAIMYAIEGEASIDNIKLIRTLALHPSYNVNKIHELYTQPICSCSITSCTDLMYAIIYKRDDVVDLLLTLPECDVNLNDSNGQPVMAHVFHRTSYYMESIIELVSKLIEHHSYEPNRYHADGTIDLTNAARLSRLRPGRDEVLSRLLSQPGVDVNLRDHIGDTVFEMALGDEDITLLDQLLSHESLDKKVINKVDLTGRNALHIAILQLTNHKHLAPVVSEHVKHFALSLLKCPELNVNAKDIQGKSAILYILSATMDKNFLSLVSDIISKIINHRSYHVNQTYFDGYVDLLKATHKLPSPIAIKVIDELLSLEALNVSVSDSKATVLRYIQTLSAVTSTDGKLKPQLKQLALKLINHKSYQDKNQDLLWAAGNLHWDLLENILELPGININASINACKDIKNTNGLGALEKGSSPKRIVECVKGMTLLHLACKYADKDCPFLCKLLENPDININIQDNDGYTGLMYSVQHQGPYVVQAIINHPSHCDLDIKNVAGKSVHDIITGIEDVDLAVLSLLKQHRNKLNTPNRSSQDEVDKTMTKKVQSKSVDFQDIKILNVFEKANSTLDICSEKDEDTILETLYARRKSSMIITEMYQRKLVGNQSYLCENLSPNEVLQNLSKSRVLTSDTVNEIISMGTRRHVVLKFMSVLLVNGLSTYLQFLSALRLTGQSYIADELEAFDPVEALV